MIFEFKKVFNGRGPGWKDGIDIRIFKSTKQDCGIQAFPGVGIILLIGTQKQC